MQSQLIEAGARPCGPKSKRARSGPRKGYCVPKGCAKKSQTRDKVTGRCRSKKTLKSSARVVREVRKLSPTVGQVRMAQAVAAARARDNVVDDVLNVPAQVLAEVGSVTDLGRIQVTPAFGPTSAERRRRFWEQQRMGPSGIVVNRGSPAAQGMPDLSPGAMAALANVGRTPRTPQGVPQLSPSAMAALANVGRTAELEEAAALEEEELRLADERASVTEANRRAARAAALAAAQKQSRRVGRVAAAEAAALAQAAAVEGERREAAAARLAQAQAAEAAEQAALEAANYAPPPAQPNFFGQIGNAVSNFFSGGIEGGRIDYGARRMAQAKAAARARSHKKSHKKSKSHKKGSRKSVGQRRMAQARAAAARRR